MQRIAVIGAGLMGHGIAQVFAVSGLDVTVTDVSEEVLAAVPERVRQNLQTLGSDPGPADAITLEPSFEAAVADADIVFEAAPEDLAIKQDIFGRLGEATRPDAVLATNTSVMSVEAIGRDARGPERVVGTHWWNPPFLIPLVEVVQAPGTSTETVEKTMAFLEQVGKTPVHVKRDVPGFVGNRLQHALWRQAFELVDAGVCDAATIDKVIKHGFGVRLPMLGPMENADLIGLDLTLAIHEYVLPTLDPPSEPSAGLRERVREGRLGMKSGEGYMGWSAQEADEARKQLLESLVALLNPANPGPS